ncbi:MAG TPA: urea ABC transporter permease subunit UrtC [Polyangiales bacterium]|nr:urea ABC transporter permease subunit UrtC [Polyangiales bacterium]
MDFVAKLKQERELTAVVVGFVLLGVIVPALHVFVPVDSALHVPDYMIQLLGKFACFAMVALALDLIWGFTGVLSLGQGVFFALGGYCMGMYLMRSMAGQGVYKSELPDFMVFLDWKELPWYWLGFDSFPFALIMAMLVPGVLAFCFGFLAFRSRIRGVYFSIITQAMTFAMMLLFFRNETGFGGNNGLTDFKKILGYVMQDDSTKVTLYVITIAVLAGSYFVCRALVNSKAGRVLKAIRDVESKTMFCGYNTRDFKLFAWTFAAVLSGLAGALYVPQVGIINPSEMEPSNSIEMAIWVAVGGRGTLVGALLGAGLVNGMKSWLTASYPDAWLYALAALFILVTLLLPDGMVGLIKRIAAMKRAPKAPSSPSIPSGLAPETTQGKA